MKKVLLFASVLVITLSPLFCFSGVLAEEESFICFTGNGNGPDGNNTTIIGDSITVGSTTALEEKLEGVKIYAQTGKQFAGTISGSPTGQQIVADPNTELRNFVVVALGTNGDIPAGGVQTMVNTIGESKSIIFVNNYKINDLNAYSANNTQFADAARANDNVFVADWANAAHAIPNTYIDNSDGLGVHPTNAGKQLFAQLVYDALSNAAPSSGGASTSGGGGDLSSSIPTSVSGEDNAQKTWNYLKERGLTDIAAAGALGNLEGEASFDPFRGEVGGGGGWGIIQWTPPTITDKPELHWLSDAGLAFPVNSGDNDAYLLAELHALWQRGGDSFWQTLNNETTVGSYTNIPNDLKDSYGQFNRSQGYVGVGSAFIFHDVIESSGDMDWGLDSSGAPNSSQQYGGSWHGNIRKRPFAAEKYLSLYGGTGGGGCSGGYNLGGNIVEVARQMGGWAGSNPGGTCYTWGGGRGGVSADGLRGYVDDKFSSSATGVDCGGFVRAVLLIATGKDINPAGGGACNDRCFAGHEENITLVGHGASVASEIQPGDIFATPSHYGIILTNNGNGTYDIAHSSSNGCGASNGPHVQAADTYNGIGSSDNTYIYRYSGGNQS
jgi:hypothetical protein